MAGPAASVLLQFVGVVPTWRDVLSAYACDWLEADFCYIRNTKPFGGTYIGEPRPFVGSIHKFSGEHSAEHSAAEVHAIGMLTSRVFTHCVLLAAMCNQAVDHRILGELSAAIAERFEGMVDFDSLDVPIDELGLLKCGMVRGWLRLLDGTWLGRHCSQVAGSRSVPHAEIDAIIG